MKGKLLVVLLFLWSSMLYAQVDESGLSANLSINNLTIYKNRITSSNDAVSNALVYQNKSLGFGFFASDGDYIYGLSLDISVFADDYMVNDKLTITDYFFDHEQFVYEDLKENNNFKSNDVGLMAMFGVKIIGKNKSKLYFSNRIGIKNVSDRFSKVILKESGSNNYYLTYYKFKVNPLFSYNPSLEFVYSPKHRPVSYFIYSGLYFQYYTCKTQVDIIDVKNLTYGSPITSYQSYISFSSTLMTGVGIRVGIW